MPRVIDYGNSIPQTLAVWGFEEEPFRDLQSDVCVERSRARRKQQQGVTRDELRLVARLSPVGTMGCGPLSSSRGKLPAVINSPPGR